jgi:serine beta-lactamase-like protein LACTB
MKRVTSWILALSVLTLGSIVPVSSQAQTVRLAAAPSHGEYETIVQESQALIDSVMSARNIAGLAVAVSVHGEMVWSEGFGWANIETRTPVETTTRFRIGSVSKPLSAIAIGLLYDQGRLDLDAPIQQYVPAFPEKEKGVITTRLLAGHLAGVRHYNGLEFLSTERYPNVTAGLDIFKDDTLQTQPGTQWSYSSYGWNLISAVIEGASGEEFIKYMTDNVLISLGLRHTVADHTDSIILGRTGYYDRTDDGALINSPHVDNSYKWAGGGYLSTPEDMVRFANALLGGEILEPETVQMFWTSQRKTDGEETGYGIGWAVRDSDGVRVVNHGGGSVGGNCWLAIVPEAGVVLAITSNMSGAGWGDVPARILRKFAGM